MISDSSIEEVKNRIDIIDVISDFVELKKAGSSYKALSPFTDEKTPSFFVSPSKNLFKCFSTGKGGDAITFLQEYEGFTYLETIRYLAKKYGVELEETENPEYEAERSERESIYIILNFARDHFKHLLWEDDEGKSVGLGYFRERGLNDKTIQEFDLGFSRDKWDDFLTTATEKGYQADLMEKAGMIVRKEDGKEYDRFRGRTMFPIHNLTGRVLGFGARQLTNDKKQPKYINSPESDVYNKSEVLYGLFQAKNEIRNQDRCYLVEGYMDVLALHQSGIKNVVASSGTSLTEGQIKLISRYTHHITVLFDGDPAGLKAAMKSIDMIIKLGLQVKVVAFPDGHDPDSYLREVGSNRFEEYLAGNSQDFIEFKSKVSGLDKSSDKDVQVDTIRDIMETISHIPDTIERSVYIKDASVKFGIDESVFHAEVNKIILQRRKLEARKSSESEPPQMQEIPDIQSESEKSVSKTEITKDQERECVRLLLNYGAEPEDEYGYFYKYFFEATDDIEWLDQKVFEIIQLYKESLAHVTVPSMEYFIQVGDDSLKNIIADAYFEKYELSENWSLKYKIYVARELQVLDLVFARNINLLKYRHLQLKIDEELERLKAESDPQKQDEIMRHYSEYKKYQMDYAKELGIILEG